jgi:tetratricopeptide (TPR) repeat protein
LTLIWPLFREAAVGLPAHRTPLLDRLYHGYLEDEDSAAFIHGVAQHYTTCTLERLATHGGRVTRRAAVLALGYIGQYESNAVLGRSLHDDDRGVRILAENGIRELWCRVGTESQRQQLSIIVRLNASQQYEQAIERASDLIEQAPVFAEAWNQRAIGHYQLGQYERSANDCHQALEINPYHFGAAVGMAHCYLELQDAFAALECFRRAIKLNPGMEDVRAQVEYLERQLEGK